MSQPFAFDEEGRTYINETEVLKGQMIVSAAGISLPADFAGKAQEKADLLERRLARLEKQLSLDPICAD
ncbi:hypothetical protein HT737_00225 [Pseudomonas sp. MD195_PC81_125]|uniref:hypothetical protein n=1 Tax=Pseudomonas sp. MD195_PC81_125 TaxID=2741560 RepID=UPI0015FE7BE6|nr:hypothetical protein [Pseudomonas sp. MD195_PC81_125]MBA5978768.1 hypothetical protein [Pseudomonas sp. MD195_PC81_125]